MKNLKPNEQRAKNAIILIWIVLILEIISLLSSYFQYDLLQTVANGGELSMETADANDMRESLIGIIYVITYIISAITFIMWFRRAYYNLHQKVNHLQYSEGWAAGSWFVPIIGLFRPYQIMKELYQTTQKILSQNNLLTNTNLTTAYIGWWWTLWIISSFLGQFGFRFSLKAESISELTTLTITEMIINIVGIPLALITIKVIKDYSQMEPMLGKVEDKEEATEV